MQGVVCSSLTATPSEGPVFAADGFSLESGRLFDPRVFERWRCVTLVRVIEGGRVEASASFFNEKQKIEIMKI